MRQTRTVAGQHLKALSRDIQRAGYYPAILSDVLAVALAGQEVESHLVHAETVFDRSEVRRHVTALVLTSTRLIVGHVDDVPSEHPEFPPAAAATTESVTLGQIRAVGITHGIADPDEYRPGNPAAEVTLAISWGAVSRVDMEPAVCQDPQCEADHGYSGTIMPDDLVVRVSEAAEGRSAVTAAVQFATALSRATAGTENG